MRFLTACLFLIYSSCLFAQNVHYSHQLIRNRKESAVQLIANIGATNHLLILKKGGRPKINVYDQSLQLKTQTEIPIKILRRWNVQIFSLRDHYYLFFQTPGTGAFQLWKINENGSSKNMTPVLRQLAKKGFLHEGAQMYLFTDSIHLHTLTFEKKDSAQLQLRHVLFNEKSASPIHHQINLPDTNELENLQQTTMTDDHNLLLLRSILNNREENILEVMKCNLHTGEIETTRFNFYKRRILKPEMLFSAVDSSIIVHSIIVHPVIDGRWSVFISRIKKLRPVAEPGALPPISSPYCYVFMNGVNEHWFDYSNKMISQYNKYSGNIGNFDARVVADSSSFANRVLVDGYAKPYGTSPLYAPLTNSTQFYFPHSNSKRIYKDHFYFSDLEFLSVDRQNKLSYKTNSFGEKNSLEINPQETGIVERKNKSLLIMKQIIRKNATGLLMIYYDQQLKIEDLPVYEHYDYLLSKMKAGNDGSIIIPYINKKETGLVKLGPLPTSPNRGSYQHTALAFWRYLFFLKSL